MIWRATKSLVYVGVCVYTGMLLIKWKVVNILNQLIRYCHTTLYVSLKSSHKLQVSQHPESVLKDLFL